MSIESEDWSEKMSGFEVEIDCRLDPGAVFAVLSPWARPFLLDDAVREDRASVIGIHPSASYRWHRGKGRLEVAGESRPEDDVLRGLRRLREHDLAGAWARSAASGKDPGPRGSFFGGGLLGFLGYGVRQAFEPGPDRNPPDASLPDLWFGAYDLSLQREGKDGNWVLRWDGPQARADEARWRPVVEALEAASAPDLEATAVSAAARRVAVSSIDRPGYLDRVEMIREFIRAGDVYQVNLTQRWLVPCSDTAASLFERLQREHPAPYAALFEVDGAAVLSCSPESFLKVEGDLVRSRPIKGTIARSSDPDEDAARAQQLLASEKDRAELTMIVDLIRNDLSRVCRPGSVEVHRHAHLERAPTVHHLETVVEGRLRERCDFFDLLAATFPGGSITGAPKVRAMQRIDELETVQRGIYTGSIGYLDRDGRAELSIAIRTLVLEGGYARIHGGGGIVIDSEPESEYDESLVKVQGLLDAVQRVDAPE